MKDIEEVICSEKIEYRKVKNRLVISNPKKNNIHHKIFSILERKGVNMNNWIYYYSEKGKLVLQKHPELM